MVLAFILLLLWMKGYLGEKEHEDTGEMNLFPLAIVFVNLLLHNYKLGHALAVS